MKGDPMENGECACEGHGFTKISCQAVGCCLYDDANGEVFLLWNLYFLQQHAGLNFLKLLNRFLLDLPTVHHCHCICIRICFCCQLFIIAVLVCCGDRSLRADFDHWVNDELISVTFCLYFFWTLVNTGGTISDVFSSRFSSNICCFLNLHQSYF